MTTKAAFSPDQWDAVLEGPPSAGMIVATAARGGIIRESIAMSKAYLEARSQHRESDSSTRSSRRSLRWTTPGTLVRSLVGSGRGS